MIKVAISQRLDTWTPYNEERDSLDHRWYFLFEGVSPDVCIFPVPNFRPDLLPRWLGHIGPDLIVLSGGNDVGSSVVRDQTEAVLVRCALRNSIPVLGICRGAQLLWSFFGGSLVELPCHINTRHEIMPMTDDLYFPSAVNSFHKTGLAGQVDDLVPLVVTKSDRSIEAFRHVRSPIEGWLWHPERDDASEEVYKSRIMALIGKEVL